MAYKYDENRRAAYNSYEGTFTDSIKGVLSEEDQTVYDLILDEVRRKNLNNWDDSTRFVLRRRYRGPRAHRKTRNGWGTRRFSSNVNNTQSMCHRADSTHFDVYIYEERV